MGRDGGHNLTVRMHMSFCFQGTPKTASAEKINGPSANTMDSIHANTSESETVNRPYEVDTEANARYSFVQVKKHRH